VVIERCVVLRAISDCFLDAVMAKIRKNGSLLKSLMKKKEREPHELPSFPSQQSVPMHRVW